jgi:hypothetical protein
MSLRIAYTEKKRKKKNGEKETREKEATRKMIDTSSA